VNYFIIFQFKLLLCEDGKGKGAALFAARVLSNKNAAPSEMSSENPIDAGQLGGDAISLTDSKIKEEAVVLTEELVA